MNVDAQPVVQQPMPIGRLLDEAMRHTRRNFLAIFPGVALPLALGSALLVLAQASRLSRFVEASQHGRLGEFAMHWISILGVVFVFYFVVWIGMNAMLVAALKHLRGEPIRMVDIVSWLLKLRVMGMLALCYAAIIIGYFMCLVPGFAVASLLGLVVPVMACEGVLGFDAIRRATDLIFYNPQQRFATNPFFRLLLILFVGYLVSVVVGWIVQAPLAIFTWVKMWRNATAGQGMTDPAFMYKGWMLVAQAAQAFLSMAGMMAVMVYVWNCVALFYTDLRARREGGDLSRALDAAGAPAQGTGPR